MKKADVVTYYGSQTAAAKAAGVTVSAVCQWGDQIPERHAWRLQFLTGGALRVNPQDYERPRSTAPRTRLTA